MAMPGQPRQTNTWTAWARTTVTDLFAYQRSDGSRVARSTIDDTVALGSVASSAGSLVADGLKDHWEAGRVADAKSASSWGQALTGLYEVGATVYRGYQGLEHLGEHKINNLAKTLAAAAGVVKAVTDGYTDAEKEANPRVKQAESVANYVAAAAMMLDLATRVNTQRLQKRREDIASRTSSPTGSVQGDPEQRPVGPVATAASLPQGNQPTAPIPLTQRRNTAPARSAGRGR
ncbi:hypothetical protein AB0J80_14495 [Actinoplanes sp. NPDC049548]|uniref:hypothetical protein n=1 Tax=Actinoplanes sp. NPDC049548 TaxID=3155152 RepID=UPI003448BD74